MPIEFEPESHYERRDVGFVFVPTVLDPWMLQEIIATIETNMQESDFMGQIFTIYWTKKPPFHPIMQSYAVSIRPGLPGDYDGRDEKELA